MLNQMLKKTVEQFAEKTAVVYGESRITYQELGNRVEKFSQGLSSIGVNPSECVALILPNCPEFIISFYGIARIGAIALFLNPSFKESELEEYIRDSNAVAIITDNTRSETCSNLIAQLDRKVQLVVVGGEEGTNLTFDNVLAKGVERYQQKQLDEGDVLYQYSSGSTGKPKRICRTQKNIFHQARNCVVTLDIAESDNIFCIVPFYHAYGFGECLLAATHSGATLVILEPYLQNGKIVEQPFIFRQARILEAIAEEKITILPAVPYIYSVLAAIPSTTPADLSTLRLCISAGNYLPKDIFDKFYTRFGISIRQLYGCTEAGSVAMNMQSGGDFKYDSIGLPMKNVEIKIIDAAEKELPPGVVGEVAIKSQTLTRGYDNAPDANKEAFKNGYFLTGDLGKKDEEGYLYITGRQKFLIDTGGYKVNPLEVEAVLAEHPKVSEVVIVGVSDAHAGQLVKAIVVPKGECREQDIFDYCQDKLAEFKIPKIVGFRQEIPKSSLGKILRDQLVTESTKLSQNLALKAKVQTQYNRSSLKSVFVPPRNHLEEKLVKIWENILNLSPVGVEDNFFELGINSIDIMRIVNRLQEELELTFDVTVLFEEPTIEKFANYLQKKYSQTAEIITFLQKEQEWRTSNQNYHTIERINRDNDISLSFAQERLWFLDKLEEKSDTYNEYSGWRLFGNLSIESLEKALQEIVRRHESLRTTFKTENGIPIQIIAPTIATPLNIIDLQQLAEAEQETEVINFVKQEVQKPFDLEKGPLLRVNLLQLAPQRFVFTLTIHHIIFDGWSMGVLLGELSTLYLAFSKGEKSPLAELPIQYADYALWQREWLKEQQQENQLNYWKQKLADVPPLLELPTDRPRPSVQTFQGGTESFKLSKELTEKLQNLSKQSGCTLFMTLLAAWSSLLYRYTQQSDILVGTPIANRQREEIEPLIGFFANTLVMRTQFLEGQSFADVLKSVRQTAIEAYAHQDVPLEQLVAELELSRSLSYNPLFQVMFALQNADMGSLEFPGVSCSQLEWSSVVAKFDLTLSMQETESGLMGYWEYNSDLFDGATIGRWMGHFEELLESIVANPQQQVDKFPLLRENERHQLLVEWNDTATDYPQDKCIHQLFSEQVERTPDAVAVVFEDEQLTYRELNSRSNQIAHYLQGLGVGPEVLVGLCVERSLEMVVGLLGILKAGGAYVPLDPDYPSERLAYMLEDSGISVLLTFERLVEQLPSNNVQAIYLDSPQATFTSQSQENTDERAKPDNLAYIIYTSGSTGKPKGVLVTHQGLCNLAKTQITIFDVQQNSHILQFASLSFDASISEIVMSICSGARLDMGTSESLQPGPDLRESLQKQEITHVTLPPSVLATLRKQDLPRLENIIVAGETCPKDLVEEWSVGRRFFNAYGPTESTVCASVAECTNVNQNLPIGRPIANVQIYILDAHLQPVPIGVPGELHIGGAGLARGYLNRPELTSQKFIPNPFSNETGSRLYKTGDLARYLPDGNIEFMGRIDNQVKIRGFRIELGEIETVLTQHPKVVQAVIIAREDNSGDKRLVAYIVPGSTIPSISEYRIFLKQKLPDYMVPTAFVILEKLPLTPNGKVDRRGLPAPLSNLLLREGFVAPQTSKERTLAQIWQEILRVEQVGVNDNFFTIGGDSILSIQIVSRAREAGIYITPRQLFEYQTIAELAEAANTEPPIQAQQGIVLGEVLLTPIQQEFFSQKRSCPHHFNQSFLLEVPHDLNEQLLRSALNQLLLHHDALRLRYVQQGEQWQQFHVGPDFPASLERVDLSAIPPLEQKSEMERIATTQQASLNLAKGPLLRAVLFDLGREAGARLLIIIHHLAVDGVSWRILLVDLLSIYQQLVQNEPLKLPPKTTAFQDWALKLRDYSQSVALKSQLEYWLHQSSEEVVPLPVDKPADRSDNTIASRSVVSVNLSETQTQTLLQQVPKAYNTQINDVLLTALAQSLASWQGTSTVLIDLEGHGREDLFAGIDLSRTVGWFTSIFPVILSLNDSPNLGAALKSIKEQLRAIPQAGFGYGVLRYLHPDEQVRAQLEDLRKSEVVFNYLGQFALPDLQTSGWEFAKNQITGSNYSEADREQHLLSINAIVIGGKLQVDWSYSNHFHNPATIEWLADKYQSSLVALIEHCLSASAGGYTPSDFPEANLSQEELDRLAAKAIEAIYPLSPMQEGMLFHSLLEPNSGVYVTQMLLTIEQPLNVDAFKQAWQQLVQNHGVLRTAFLWEREQPLQLVRQQVSLPWQEYNWQNLSEDERQQSLENLLESDSRQGFDLQQAPLMRCTLIQVGTERYQLLWSNHHILTDGWSLPILFEEMLQLYDAFNQGQIISVSQERPYRDYIRWLLQQDATAAQAFWQKTLAGFDTPTPLVVARTVRENAARHSLNKEQNLQLSSSVTEQLQAICLEHRLTTATLIQAAWALLLSRYSGEEEVLFGVTVSGRSAVVPGIEQMVGLFINTLPLRISVPREMPLLSWLQQVQEAQITIQDYAYSPLAEVQKLAEIPAGMPLFESILVFENYPMNEQLQSLKHILNVTGVKFQEKTNYPLTIVAVPGQELLLRINYDSERFATDTIARMLGHLQSLLEAMVSNPEARVGELPLLTESERYQLLVEWNDTATDYPQDKCIHQLFEEQVERTPDAVAVVFEDEQLTYCQLNARANQLAHYLRDLGVGPEVLVGIFLERSLEMVVGLLGILKAGGAYVPLDPDYPQERITYMIKNSQLPILLTQNHLKATLPQYQGRVLSLDSDWELIATESEENPVSGVTSENLIYIIYTSGSTGKPKGTMNTHKGVVNRILWMQDEYQLNKSDRVLHKTPFSFDVSGWEFWWTLIMGARLIVAKPEGHKEPHYLVELIIEQQITTIHFVPSMLEIFLENLNVESCSSLRQVFCSGEALATAIQEQFFNHLKAELHNLYGPTEAAIDVTFWHCQPDSQLSSVPIGRPVANTQIYILDSNLKPVPIGVPGELYLGGVQLARGYLHRPELTAERFIQNPFFDDFQSSHLYKTGDLARYLRDGNIEFIGRIDNQVKIRGFRIELGEIETILTQHPNVVQAAAIAREDNPGNKHLVAYIVTSSIVSSISEYRNLLKQKLPDYMRPSAFVLLEKLPLTPNGKIDRRALPAPDLASVSETNFVPPSNPTEELLAAIWSKILGIEKIGIHNNFFELGGHSLKATQVISGIRKTFGIELPLRHLFSEPTVAELAPVINATIQARGTVEVVEIKSRIAEAILTLSFAQERLWFLDKLEGKSATYNIPGAWRLFGNLSIESLKQALQEIVRRHESLRTTFKTENGIPIQIIAPSIVTPLSVIDLQQLAEAEQETEVINFVKQEAQKPFDLETGSLLRVNLLQLAPQRFVFTLTIHHIISDGWSMGVLFGELSALYIAFSKGEKSPLAELPIQYADYALWQREWLKEQQQESQLNYWKQKLADAPPLLELPTDRPRPSMQTFRGGTESFKLSKELTQKLHALSKQSGCTLFMTLLAAWSSLLYRYSQQSDILVGTPIANRQHQEIEPLIGFFANTLVLRTQFLEGQSFADVLKGVRQTAIEGYANQDVPFEQLVAELELSRSLSHNPLFQVMFALQNADMGSLEFPGVRCSQLERFGVVAKFDLTLSMQETESGLRGYWEYNRDLFDGATIGRWMGHFEVLLESIVANPQQQVSQLPLLTENERHQLLVEWNDTTTDYPQDRCIHQLFEQQVERTPDAVAVVFEEERLTYRELNDRANQLAHYLRDLGVRPEVLVGICVERSLEMIIGLLGILKAGGAYVPLDPNYPSERLAYMLEDSAVPVLLTSEKLVEQLPSRDALVISLDASGGGHVSESQAKPIERVKADNLAYVIYTSGSTGKPKGVAITHCNVLALLYGFEQLAPSMNPIAGTFLCPFSFDLSVWELFSNLCFGGTVHILVPSKFANAKTLSAYLINNGITSSYIPPALLAECATELEAYGSDSEQAGIALVRLLVGVEPIEQQLLQRYQNLSPELKIINGYGPTETTICATLFNFLHSTEPDRRTPIGKAVPGYSMYIVNINLQPVPIGVPGELHIGGAGLARGYLNRPELTSQKFIPNPFSNEPGSRLYKTGDLARYLADGNIEYIGRIDNQVKIRGFRIELGEIETVLTQHPNVVKAVAIAREDNPGDKRLVGYIVAGSTVPSINELRSFLKSQLPDYMLPSAFVILESLPLTPNGKIDRRALPVPEIDRSQLETTYIQPESDLEKTIAQVWLEALKIEKVGIKDNFFDLGGNSLLLVRVHSQLSQQLEQKLSIIELFQYPTIQTLANYLSPKENRQSTVEATSNQTEMRRAAKATRKERRQRRNK